MSIEIYIKVKTLLFLPTIWIMCDQEICKKILTSRAEVFNDDYENCSRNVNYSYISGFLNGSIYLGFRFGNSFFVTCMPIVANSWLASCKWWRKPEYPAKTRRGIELWCKPLYEVISDASSLTWREMSDICHLDVWICETLSEIVAGCSLLKTDDRLKRAVGSKWCNSCDLWPYENTLHMVQWVRNGVIHVIYHLCA